MKIIEALKSVKDLHRKADDIVEKIKKHCADLDCETQIYPDQKRQVAEWLQAHSDVLKEILRLKTALLRTNLATNVTIELGNKQVTKSIAEWIERRRSLSELELNAWSALTDRGLKETYENKLTPNSPATSIKRRLYFDPVERDEKREMYRSEPSKIDATLEIVNATTDLI
jgi:hypothetical protein